MKVKCPTCQKEVQWSSTNQYRPFCSERCKLIDFGAWASEEHAIPGKPNLDDWEEGK
ncbi:MAG: DNA gyrase inhibitor YacG [Venatoribacter sp.]